MVEQVPHEPVVSLRKVFVGLVVLVSLVALPTLMMSRLSVFTGWTNSRRTKKLLNFHGSLVNTDDNLLVVLFGHDGPDDDINKYVSEVRPNQRVEPREWFHVDFVVTAKCTVWKYRGPFGWRWRWTWQKFETELGRSGERWVREIRQALGEAAPPPCGTREN